MCKHYIPKKSCKRGHMLRYKANGACVQCEKKERIQNLTWKHFKQLIESLEKVAT